MIATLVADAVRSTGLRVDSAGSAAACLQALDAGGAANQPAAILLDILMPDGDGFDVMRALAARQYRAPVLVVSGAGAHYLGVAREFGRVCGLNLLDALPKPLDPGRLLGHVEALGSAPAPRPPVVMVVDDEALVRSTAVELLAHAGYTVLQAGDGRDALQQLRDHGAVDLLFTDIDMPVMNGMALAIEVERLYPTIRIMLTSGKIGDAPVANLPFVAKPYRYDTLIQATEEALAS